MRQLKFILFASIFLCSCKSPNKTFSGSKLSKEARISNDISLTDEKYLSELTEQVIKKLIEDQLCVSVKQIKYDTNKSIVKETGRHPVIEETEIRINRATKINVMDSIHHMANCVTGMVVKGKSTISTKIKTEEKQEKEIGLKEWQKALMIIGGLVFVGFIVFRFIKI